MRRCFTKWWTWDPMLLRIQLLCLLAQLFLVSGWCDEDHAMYQLLCCFNIGIQSSLVCNKSQSPTNANRMDLIVPQSLHVDIYVTQIQNRIVYLNVDEVAAELPNAKYDWACIICWQYFNNNCPVAPCEPVGFLLCDSIIITFIQFKFHQHLLQSVCLFTSPVVRRAVCRCWFPLSLINHTCNCISLVAKSVNQSLTWDENRILLENSFHVFCRRPNRHYLSQIDFNLKCELGATLSSTSNMPSLLEYITGKEM